MEGLLSTGPTPSSLYVECSITECDWANPLGNVHMNIYMDMFIHYLIYVTKTKSYL